MSHPYYAKSKKIPFKYVEITDTFWFERHKININAIFYQWKQLERTHTIDNFRILAGEKEGYRLGFFYCDSDLHKWADAAARILAITKNETLTRLIREYIDLIEKTQNPNGYLFTYNQFHFPNRRWANLQIEHELYCLGHMIEAAVSYMETSEDYEYKLKFLEIAMNAANLLVRDFLKARPKYTPGHQEIEIALIRLYRLTKKKEYLELASHLLNQRGKIAFFALRLINQSIDQTKRAKFIKKDMIEKRVVNDINMSFFGGETKHQKEASFLTFRSLFQYLSGRYQQQNKPIRKMKRPFGHSVRWGYLATAMTMLYQETGDTKLLYALERTWDHLIQKQMFITGGIGSLGTVEGFGRDYELPNDSCYCETCAAIANIMLNWELALTTNQAKYSDLLEWQLYNALNVGISLNGESYLYRNLLETDGLLSRKDWFATPCCPSNISRIWASISGYIYSFNSDNLWIHQYIGSKTTIPLANGEQLVKIEMVSEFPWYGKIKLIVEVTNSNEFTINIRIPSWTKKSKIKINQELYPTPTTLINDIKTGSGFDPNKSYFVPIRRKWAEKTIIEIEFPMEINIHRAHPKVKSNKKRIALSRGPLVYCIESIDNPTISIPRATIDLSKPIEIIHDNNFLDGFIKLYTKSSQNRELISIPYFYWANRGPSKMQVWINYNSSTS
ncbi:MAG: glycoside hydrolase family 127 protein [Candidatus Heimdallarchaeota archaeon]|nr:glycoside hydrolase family 127 protein [Candidatus Heimdallarchaeota archaeon]